jgi:hypothetical protein
MIENISSLIEKYKEAEADMVDHSVEEAPYIPYSNLDHFHIKTENSDGLTSSEIASLENKSISTFILNYSRG